MKRITRRNFMKDSLVAGASLALSDRVVHAARNLRVRGANDDIRVAVVHNPTQVGKKIVDP